MLAKNKTVFTGIEFIARKPLKIYLRCVYMCDLAFMMSQFKVRQGAR
jgi:hypothetical protein